MCFKTSRPTEEFSEEAIDFAAVEEERNTGENHLFLVNGFVNLNLDSVEAFPQVIEEREQPIDFIVHPYEVLDALASYLTELADYDEIDPRFFAEVDSFAEPSVIFQEL